MLSLIVFCSGPRSQAWSRSLYGPSGLHHKLKRKGDTNGQIRTFAVIFLHFLWAPSILGRVTVWVWVILCDLLQCLVQCT